VFNATFSNISAISWRPVLVVEEAGYLERTIDHEQGKLKRLMLYYNEKNRTATKMCEGFKLLF